jgi:transcriptional regulator with XRE-family HTH domain
MNHKEFLKSIGMEIRIARVRKGLSQGKVASMTGLQVITISDLERGQLDSHILTYKRIADALGMDMKDFL